MPSIRAGLGAISPPLAAMRAFAHSSFYSLTCATIIAKTSIASTEASAANVPSGAGAKALAAALAGVAAVLRTRGRVHAVAAAGEGAASTPMTSSEELVAIASLP